MHQPISLKDVSLSFSNKNCFDGFSTQIYPGSRIAIIGRNGSGKSCLLNILRQRLSPSEGQVILPNNLCIGYVEQTISDFDDLSGGQRLNKRLTEALARSPDVLLLDEPTNHLDLANRKSLIRMLQTYQGTLIIVSHDTEVLRTCIQMLWHIDHHKVHEFSGSYDDYIREIKLKRTSLEKELSVLKREKKETHTDLMKEQQRANKRKAYGKKKYAGDKLALRGKQAQGQATCNKNNKFINDKKNNLLEQLSGLYLPEIIIPKFSLSSKKSSNGTILSLSNTDIGYEKGNILLKKVNLSISAKERVALCGKNASGKSTLFKAILGAPHIVKTGQWHLPNPDHIGYLDQHYSNLDPKLSVLEHVRTLRPDWHETEARRHLNDFLFRKNEEVLQLAVHLSGGEKARLSLSLIAAKTPRLLLLDEITNNLDLETKEHVIQVLKAYPGAMVIVSHEEDFIQSIDITHKYQIQNGHIT